MTKGIIVDYEEVFIIGVKFKYQDDIIYCKAKVNQLTLSKTTGDEEMSGEMDLVVFEVGVSDHEVERLTNKKLIGE